MAWKKGERIPTNLIVGFLGSGKTTAIKQLIDRRPPGEKWSIFINEYGMVSIDQAERLYGVSIDPNTLSIRGFPGRPAAAA